MFNLVLSNKEDDELLVSIEDNDIIAKDDVKVLRNDHGCIHLEYDNIRLIIRTKEE